MSIKTVVPMSMLTSGNDQNVNAIDHTDLSTQSSEAEIKKDER